MADFPLAEVERILGTHFRDPTLLAIAFGKSGSPRFCHGRPVTQKMLAYFGDALIEAAVRRWILLVYGCFPDRWNDWCCYSVSNLVLARVVEGLEIEPMADLEIGLDYDHALGTLFEAIVAAVDIDRGAASTENFLVRHYLRHLPKLINGLEQRRGLRTLSLKVKELIGSEPLFSQPRRRRCRPGRNEWTYIIDCYVSGEHLSRGEGKNEVEARISALRNGVARLRAAAGADPPDESVGTLLPLAFST